jgi:hypothetical protein
MATFTIHEDNNLTAFVGAKEAAQAGERNRAVRQNRNMSLLDDFPIIPHESAEAGMECCGCIGESRAFEGALHATGVVDGVVQGIPRIRVVADHQRQAPDAATTRRVA